MRVVQQKLPKIILFFMVLPFLAATMSVGSAHALALQETTNQVTQPIRTLLNPITQLPSLHPFQPTSQSTPNSHNSATAPAPASGQAPQAQAANSPASSAPLSASGLPQIAPLDEAAFLEKMQPINKKSLSNRASSAKLASAMINNSTTHSTMSDVGLLQATEDGWQLLGLQWYWWAALGATTWAGVQVFRSRLQA